MIEEKTKKTLKEETDKEFYENLFDKIKSLPLKEKLKAIALMNLYLERKKLDEEFEKEIKEITLKYEALSMPFYRKVVK